MRPVNVRAIHTVESDRSKYGTFYFDSFPDILFSLCTRFPVLSRGALRQLVATCSADKNRSGACFVRTEHAAVAELQPVYLHHVAKEIYD